MRIYFTSMDLPKKAAKRIQRHFTPTRYLIEPMKLSQAQAITAFLLGYDDWHELDKSTKSGMHDPSELDENASAEEQRKRIDFQVQRLSMLQPQTEPLIRDMVLRFRVSAGNPLSTNFDEDAYRENSLLYWEPYGEPPEWRFRPSHRSEEVRDELYCLLNTWTSSAISTSDYIEQLKSFYEKHPENITPYLYTIEAFELKGHWTDALDCIEKLEQAIMKSIPASYPIKRKVAHVNWWTVENRDYLRALYWLGVGFYANKKYKKAKQWFLFLKRCSSRNIGDEVEFLRDLRLPNRKGNVHRRRIS